MEVTSRERTACAHERKHAQGKRQLEEEQHMCMGGKPNVDRVRVFLILCKMAKEPEMYKYRYVGIR
jgi:hypothetical protein